MAMSAHINIEREPISTAKIGERGLANGIVVAGAEDESPTRGFKRGRLASEGVGFRVVHR
jgi:hypothetical protein